MAINTNDLLGMLQKAKVVFTTSLGDDKRVQARVAASTWDDPMHGKWTLAAGDQICLITVAQLGPIGIAADSDNDELKAFIASIEYTPPEKLGG